jgi:hypothetical protein
MGWLALANTWPLAAVFLVSFIICLRSYLKTHHIISLHFTLAFLSFVLTYAIWGVRALVVAEVSTIEPMYWYWIMVYFTAAFGIFNMDLATISFLKGINNKALVTFIKAIFGVTFASVVYILLFTQVNLELLTLSGISDLNFADQWLKYYLFIVLGIFILIPNGIFYYYLKISQKTSPAHKKVKILMIGFLIMSLGFSMDAVRLPNDLLMFIFRMIVLLGGLIIMIALFYKVKSGSIEAEVEQK